MHRIWQHFSKRTLALIIVLMLITGGLLYLAIREEQPTREAAIVPTPTPSPAHSVLSLLPAGGAISAVQSANVVVDSGTNKLTGAQLNISFDPKVLSNVTVTAGTYFDHPTILLNNVDKANGRISYVLAISPTGTEATGSGTIATISYTILPTASTSTMLTFLPKTEVTQQGILGSVLQSTNNLEISIPEVLQISPTASQGAY